MSASNKILNVLIAYPYFSEPILEFLSAKKDFRLIVDSGAFTAWNTGKKVTMEGYTSFLKTIPREWEYRAVQLDVYGDPSATYRNWRAMMDDGWTDVMPVFTRGEKPERLEEFYSKSDYIMFGGIAFGGSNRNYIKFFHRINRGRKAHWLGFCDQSFVRAFAPESVDSSSITSCGRYGNMSFMRRNGMLKTLPKATFSERPPAEFIESTLQAGFTSKEIRSLGRRESWVGAARSPNGMSSKGVASFMSYVHHLRSAYAIERNIGTKVYFAFASLNDLEALFEARKFLAERGVE